jgi:lipopolysaccharide/colanic/teichoic acid biosynthesis glycosyltransferase
MALDDTQTLRLDETGALPWRIPVQEDDRLQAGLKRVLDVVLASVLLLVTAPVLLAAMGLIRLTSPGSAIFCQSRVGYRCRRFPMLKLRTMVDGAEEREEELAVAVAGTFLKLDDDPRITRLGRWLRRSSLDELPQLWNVLRGEMSLVGPRPLLPTDFERYPKHAQMRRFSRSPGLTGLWQVSGRSETSDRERIRLDLEYVDHWSLWLDLKILARTVPAVLSGRGAT